MPHEPIVVSTEAGDDIVVAIAIHVVGKHVGSTGCGELHLVQLPFRIAGYVFRLFEPTVFEDQILTAIVVHIANAEAMTETLGGDVF